MRSAYQIKEKKIHVHFCSNHTAVWPRQELGSWSQGTIARSHVLHHVLDQVPAPFLRPGIANKCSSPLPSSPVPLPCPTNHQQGTSSSSNFPVGFIPPCQFRACPLCGTEAGIQARILQQYVINCNYSHRGCNLGCSARHIHSANNGSKSLLLFSKLSKSWLFCSTLKLRA